MFISYDGSQLMAILMFAAIVACVAAMHLLMKAYARVHKLEEKAETSSFLLFLCYFGGGVLVCLSFIILTAIDCTTFARAWYFLFAWKHCFDVGMFIIWRHSLPVNWRVFLSFHHALAFLFAGFWSTLPGPL